MIKKYKEEFEILEKIYYEDKRTSMDIHDFLNTTLYLKSFFYLYECCGDKMTKEQIETDNIKMRKEIIKIKEFIKNGGKK